MIYPAVRFQQMYSLNVSNTLDIIFEDLNLISLDELKNTVTNKKYENITIIPGQLVIDTKNKLVTVLAHKINDNKYIISLDKSGVEHNLSYESNEDMITCIEYLYHMYKNLV